MRIVRDPAEMHDLCVAARAGGTTVALAPTMGALHEGHLSLLKVAKERCDLSVVSIFVNPIQFGPGEDLEKYPRRLDKDCELVEAHGCDIVFAPRTEDIYPSGFRSHVEVAGITRTLEGASRPGHFGGVTTVVLKLFNIVIPHVALFGQKDAQQVIVLKRMVRDLNVGLELVVAPTCREDDGLAVSSRNVYLTREERAGVAGLYKGLAAVERAYDSGERSARRLKEEARKVYAGVDIFDMEYLEIADTDSLDSLDTVTAQALVAAACRTTQSHTRLIDNVVLGGTL